MSIQTHLSALEVAGLIRLAGAAPSVEYLFRHGLVQDAAYSSLLKSERAQLHGLTGQVLEEFFPDRQEEYAPRLAEHFWQAGDTPRALNYILQSARSAERRFANAESIAHFSWALKATSEPSVQFQIYVERGFLYETIGDFGAARTDYDLALAIARDLNDQRYTWDVLVRLGRLWAARDYRQTEHYIRQALVIAEKGTDLHTLARSLSWMGNTLTNLEEPDQARIYLERALNIFEDLEDNEGLAETHDLLGMTNILGGDLFRGRAHLESAVALFEKLEKPHGLASSLATLALVTPEFQTDTMACPLLPADEAAQLAHKSLQIAQQLGWKSGQIFALCNLSLCQAAHGDYQGAFSSVDEASALVDQIQHQQWRIFTLFIKGLLHLYLQNFQRAQAVLTEGLALAEAVYSLHWIRSGAGLLALVKTRAGDLEGATTLLDRYAPLDLPAQTVGQRHCWFARAELALAQGNAQEALQICARVAAADSPAAREGISIRMGLVKGCALLGVAEQSPPVVRAACLEEARQVLEASLEEARRQKIRSREWQILQVHARVLGSQGDLLAARKESRLAKKLAEQLKQNIAVPD